MASPAGSLDGGGPPPAPMTVRGSGTAEAEEAEDGEGSEEGRPPPRGAVVGVVVGGGDVVVVVVGGGDVVVVVVGGGDVVVVVVGGGDVVVVVVGGGDVVVVVGGGDVVVVVGGGRVSVVTTGGALVGGVTPPPMGLVSTGAGIGGKAKGRVTKDGRAVATGFPLAAMTTGRKGNNSGGLALAGLAVGVPPTGVVVGGTGPAAKGRLL